MVNGRRACGPGFQTGRRPLPQVVHWVNNVECKPLTCIWECVVRRSLALGNETSQARWRIAQPSSKSRCDWLSMQALWLAGRSAIRGRGESYSAALLDYLYFAYLLGGALAFSDIQRRNVSNSANRTGRRREPNKLRGPANQSHETSEKGEIKSYIYLISGLSAGPLGASNQGRLKDPPHRPKFGLLLE